MRLFLGLSGADLESDSLDRLCLDNQVYGAHLPQDRHMTLCFLGSCSEAQKKALISMLDGCGVEKELPVQWRGGEVSLFPSGDGVKPTAWAVQGPLTESLKRIMSHLAEIPMLKASFRNHFLPHISLAYSSGRVYPSIELEVSVKFTQLVLYVSLDEKERGSSESISWAKPRYIRLRVWECDKK